MISKLYREVIEKGSDNVWVVIQRIDIKTGCPVCLECGEIISEEEDEDNNGLCDYCDCSLRIDEVRTTEHPDVKHNLMGAI